MFSCNSLAFSMIQQMLAIWSLVPLPFLKPAWTSGSSRLTYCSKPCLENFEHYFTSMRDECNCVVVWAFFAIAFLWDWNENWSFPGLWPMLSFPNLSIIAKLIGKSRDKWKIWFVVPEFKKKNQEKNLEVPAFNIKYLTVKGRMHQK